MEISGENITGQVASPKIRHSMIVKIRVGPRLIPNETTVSRFRDSDA